MSDTQKLVARIARDLIKLRDMSDHPARNQLATLAASAVFGLYQPAAPARERE